jgi:DNA-binding CsgD family transcriptional regulator
MAGGVPPVAALTGRQLSVLALVADGRANAEIAQELSCSEHTVKNVIYELMARLQVRNRAHAVAHAVRAGLI